MNERDPNRLPWWGIILIGLVGGLIVSGIILSTLAIFKREFGSVPALVGRGRELLGEPTLVVIEGEPEATPGPQCELCLFSWHKLAVYMEMTTGVDVLELRESEGRVRMAIMMTDEQRDMTNPSALTHFLALSCIHWSDGAVQDIEMVVATEPVEGCYPTIVKLSFRTRDGMPELWHVDPREGECLEWDRVLWAGMGE